MPEVDYPGFRHVGLVVQDIEQCVAFYQEIGFEVLMDDQESAPLISDLPVSYTHLRAHET